MIVVTGLPRSGTSLMMQMLAAGGLPVLRDDAGPYRERYEYTPAMGSGDWLDCDKGHAVKVVEDWLRYLPGDLNCKVVAMKRDAREVAASRGYSVQDAEEAYGRLHAWLRGRDRLFVFHSRLMGDPDPEIARINTYLGGSLDTAAMARVIDRSLWHHRAA